MYPFGKSIVGEFYPLVDGFEIAEADISSIELVNIYVFADSGGKPDLSAARDGTGAVQTIASWTAVASKSGFRYTVDAIDDPDPTSDPKAYTYWVAINFKFANGEQQQCVIHELILERVLGHTRRVDVQFQDVIDAWPMANKYATTSQIEAYIKLAKGDIRSDLKARGYEYAEIRRPDRLSEAVMYHTLGHIAFGQIQQPTDHWDRQAQHWWRVSKKTVDELRFEYDGQKSGQTQTVNTQSGYRFIDR